MMAAPDGLPDAVDGPTTLGSGRLRVKPGRWVTRRARVPPDRNEERDREEADHRAGLSGRDHLRRRLRVQHRARSERTTQYRDQ